MELFAAYWNAFCCTVGKDGPSSSFLEVVCLDTWSFLILCGESWIMQA
jgi:hypothetical protein